MVYIWIHIFLAQKQPSPLKMEKRSVAAQEGLVSNLIREKYNVQLDTQKYYGAQLYSRKKTSRKNIFVSEFTSLSPGFGINVEEETITAI